ncbi:MAG: HAMP domain-containing histidine kinase [Clostridiales bacterium]|jgi:signal transduction histidine kinase|nr:HAMP domain-containing histidine kinase [Clostridiales bacterium]
MAGGREPAARCGRGNAFGADRGASESAVRDGLGGAERQRDRPPDSGAARQAGRRKLPEAPKTAKKKTSLVWRIASHQIMSNISLILSLDFLICAVMSVFLFYQVCGAAKTAAVSGLPDESAQPGARANLLFDSCALEMAAAAPVGIYFPDSLASLLGIPDGTALLFGIAKTDDVSFFHKWLSATSVFAFPAYGAAVYDAAAAASAAQDSAAAGVAGLAAPPAGGAVGTTAGGGAANGGGGTEAEDGSGAAGTAAGGAAATAASPGTPGTPGSPAEPAEPAYAFVSLTHDSLFFDLWRGLCILLAFEVFAVFSRIFKARRTTQALLRPITELTMAAQSINAGASLKLSGAIDTLNTITEQHLDRRISIEDERVELKGLASAINAMLDRLDAAYRAQLRFVSDASHELRTPISVIQGYANLLDRWGKNDEKTLQESIDAIKNETAGMKELVEQLLFLARSDNHSIVLSMGGIDVSEIAEEVHKETLMIDASHECHADIQPGLAIYGDAQLIKRVLRIFVDNSIKYTPEGGSITIKAEKAQGKPGYVAVSLSDTGIGIPEEALPYIFDRFFRADESRARKLGGTGLGLAIAKWIIESHNGYVEVLSRKDIGARFTAFFPCLPPAYPPI